MVRLFFLGPRIMGVRPGVSIPISMGSRPPPPSFGAVTAERGAFVYVVKGAHNLTKIGFSTNPDARLAQLRTASPFPIEFASVFAVDGPSGAALAIEQGAHAMLSRHRVAGEWFDVPPDMAVAAIAAVSQRTAHKIAQVDPANIATIIRLAAADPAPPQMGAIAGGFVVFGWIFALSALFALAVVFLH